MKVILTIIVLLLLGVTAEAGAEIHQKTCMGHLLYDGSFAQYCYPPLLRGEWEVVWVDADSKGFEDISFIIQKETCLRRRTNGRCWRSRRKVVKLIIYERKGMSLKEASRIIGMLTGLKRVKKKGNTYLLSRRSRRRGKRIELRSFLAHSRFLIGIESRHNFLREKTAVMEFLTGLTIEITKPR